MADRARPSGTGHAISAVLLWSTVATAFKLALRAVEPFTLLAGSALVSLVVLGAIITIRSSWHSVRSLTRRERRSCVLLGLLNPLLYYAILFIAYDRLPAQLAQPLNYTWAFALALIAVPVLGQRLKGRTLPAFSLGFLGVLVLSLGGRGITGMVDPLGVALALLSSIVWASYWAFLTRSKVSNAIILFIGFAAAAPLAVLLAAISASISGAGWWTFIDIGAAGWGGILYIGVFEMGVTFFIWSEAMRRSEEAAGIAIFIYASPFLSLLFIHFILAEAIVWTTPLALALIVAGILVQTYGEAGDGGASGM